MQQNLYNPILDTDSYKYSHYKQYPPGTEYVYSYIESRGGQFPETCVFGLDYYIRQYLSTKITKEHLEEAQDIVPGHCGSLNVEGFNTIINKHGGYWPVQIRSVLEGSVVPVKNLLVDAINTDPTLPWVTSFLETSMLRSVWYGTTVATRELEIRKSIQKYLKETSDDEAMKFIGVKHNDFGARGASSYETSQIGGLAHLILFNGTDNVPALLAAKKLYGVNPAGYSIPAAEHSTMTSWGGKEGELLAMKNMLDQYAKPGAILACVSDSYDIWNAIDNYWTGELLEQVKNSGALVVVRPDSGDPIEMPKLVIQRLMNKVGYSVNKKGYKVLPPYFRVIQGDGMNDAATVDKVLYNLKINNLATDNLAIGMGGGMLQKVDRDTQKFAMKCSSICVNGIWRDVFKDPITDPGKASKKGKLDLIRQGTEYRTIKQGTPVKWWDNLTHPMQIVYNNGSVNLTPLSSIRERVDFELAARGY
jgi:nicotinamide phosphoribosyltransferase